MHIAHPRTNIVAYVPAKPAWFGKIENVIRELEALPRPFVDRSTIEFLLGVGSSGLADRDALIARLRRLAQGDDRYYEIERRRKIARVLDRLRQERIEHPQLLVEAPVSAVQQEFDYLPPGIRLEPGRVTVEFTEPREALEKFLALAMAISNDFDRFERSTQRA